MKEIKILGIISGIILCAMLLVAFIFFIRFKDLQLVMPSKDIVPEQETLVEEKTIDLIGFTDSKKVLYETNNVIIKVSYNATKEYLLSNIESSKDLVKEFESWIAGPYKDNPSNIIGRIKEEEKKSKKSEEFLNLLESQKEKEEIVITDDPYKSYLKDINTEVLLAQLLYKGRIEVFDKNNNQNLKFIKLKITETNSHVARWYLPNGKVFFEVSSRIYR